MPSNRRTDPISVALLSLAAGPFVLSLASGNGAVVRYVLGLPMAISVVIAAILTTVLLALLLPDVARGVRRSTAAVALLASAAGCLMLYARLWNPDIEGMATVGGGDSGHHIWITNQLAFNHPTVYQGFTTFHTSTWAFAQLLGGPFEGMRGAFYMSIAGWLCGGVAIVVLACRDCRHQAVATTIGCLLLAVVWYRIHLLWAHYNQADGFFAHIHGALSLVAILLSWAAIQRWLPRAFLLGACLVIYRFTYALNAGDLLLAAALLVGLDAWRARHAQSRWTWPVLAGVGASVLVAVYTYTALWPKIGKTGGIMAPDPAWNLLALLAGMAMCAVFLRNVAPHERDQPAHDQPRHDQPAQRLAQFAALLAVVPAAVIALFLLVDGLPREYYFHKYPLTALFALTAVAPALAAKTVGDWLQRPRADRWHRHVLLACILPLLGWLVHVRATDKASAPLQQSYRERAGDLPEMRQARRLHDTRTERLARAVLVSKNAQLAGFLQPYWPVFNFSDNVLRVWREVPRRPVKGLQDERWDLFLNGVRPTTGQCVFWLAGAAAEAEYRVLKRGNSRARAPATIAAMRADPASECRSFGDVVGDDRLCWLCR